MARNGEAMETSGDGTISTPECFTDQDKIPKEFTESDLGNLYNSLGITPCNSNHVRFEAIHLRSSNELTVKDVIDYFSEFNPQNVEMVDDESYNIVWHDQNQAAKALFLSVEIENGIPVRATRDLMVDSMPIPSGNWLLGKGHINLSSVLLRFSLRGDRRPRTIEVCRNFSRDNNPTPQSEPVNQRNPWGNLSQCWDEKYELSGRDRRQTNQDDPKSRVHLKARRRFNR